MIKWPKISTFAAYKNIWKITTIPEKTTCQQTMEAPPATGEELYL
jgi:hypothetical protein